MTYADISGVPHADRYLFGMIVLVAVVAVLTAAVVYRSPMGHRPATRVAIGCGALAIVAAGSATLTTPLSVPWAATVGVAVGLVLLCNIVLGVVTRSAAQRGASDER